MITVPTHYPPEVQAAIWQEYSCGRDVRRLESERNWPGGTVTKEDIKEAYRRLAVAILHRESFKS